MNTNKKLAFSLIFAVFFSFLPVSFASADGGRYFVKSNKGFWKNALGVRHVFDNGFSADLSDFQIRLAKVFGVAIEPIAVLQILPEDQDIIEPEPNSLETLVETPAAKARVPKSPNARPVPSDQTPWGLEVIYNDVDLINSSGGAGINVAVLDTGVNSTHPDLASRIAQCKDFTNPKVSIIDGKCDDKNGHGTHVAGIIAADGGSDGKGIFGVAPEAKLFVYKVCTNSGSCYADDISVALRLAADQGAHVINMSFGSDQESSIIKNAIEYAASSGVLLVAAAGNDGPFDGSIDYPGANTSVVAVGAINKFSTVTDWSSRGINSLTIPWVVEHRDIEFAAPGEHIESTSNSGGYIVFSGTSMASPFIAGLAAKYWQMTAIDPLSATRDLLHSLATDLLPLGDDDESGFGLPRVQ